jgi:2-C-methyl-D-erythritol 2,4-cyclodiphosphate synthase
LDDALYLVENIDATIIAQKPKLMQYIPEMVKNISTALDLEEGRVNIKATTEEGLGFTGEGLGIAANAVCLLETMMNYQVDVTPVDTGKNCGSCGGCPKK